jgi:hypothetical protein
LQEIYEEMRQRNLGKRAGMMGSCGVTNEKGEAPRRSKGGS